VKNQLGSNWQGFTMMGLAALTVALLLVLSPISGAAVAESSQPSAMFQATPTALITATCNQAGYTDITIVNVQGLYGAHIKATFDFAQGQVESIQVPAGSVFASPAIVVVKTFNNATGVIEFIATRENPQAPYDNMTDTPGLLFRVYWASRTGNGCVNLEAHRPPVPPDAPQLSDRNGMDIPYVAGCQPCNAIHCQISGKVLLQGHTDPTGQRPDYSGTDIMVSTERACPTNFTYSALWDWPGMIKKQTASDGSFDIDAGQGQSCSCIYAFQHGYLTALGQGPYPITRTVMMTDITLWGGDATQDDAINIFDLTLIASHYGETHPASPDAAVADINGDNKVDIYDLTLTAGNSSKDRGPQKWYPR
jgi:hypothetical protein